jgi:glycosyltransferase involved in cell wall biosynthesis
MTPRRVTVVASELLGRAGTGGAGTADSLLAVALGRHGHRVELLVASGREIGDLSPGWTEAYASAGVEVRVLERSSGVLPTFLAPTLEVFHALRSRPPDVAIVNDWRGLGFAALRARQLGLALTETAFVVHCHGPARVLAEFAQKVPDTVGRFGEEVTERASIALADAVVSPSEWLLGWMRAHGWPVPADASVIQYVRQSVALGDAPATGPAETAAIRRIAFFGQLREGKGVRVFLAALGRVEPSLLDGVEVIFLGAESARWTSGRAAAALPADVRARLAAVRFETRLDREEALAELRVPGTLAVMPSLLDNSPNTVSECIEQGTPFVAARTGGIEELVAPEDRERVLCSPTAPDLAHALERALGSDTFAAARPARDPRASLGAWAELVESVAPSRVDRSAAGARVAVVAVGAESAVRARRIADRTASAEVEVVAAASRAGGLATVSAEWVLFLDDDDVPDDDLLEVLLAAQLASGADVVTTAVRPAASTGETRLFLGDPGALGLAENLYGVLGLVRRSLVERRGLADGGTDPDWPLFAGLALAGARIVSVPEAHAVHAGTPGAVSDVPGEGLRVLELFEAHAGAALADLPQLAATLAAANARAAPAAVADGRGTVRRRIGLLRAGAGLALRSPRRG